MEGIEQFVLVFWKLENIFNFNLKNRFAEEKKKEKRKILFN